MSDKGNWMEQNNGNPLSYYLNEQNHKMNDEKSCCVLEGQQSSFDAVEQAFLGD